MIHGIRHFDPLRPHRYFGIPEKYEFTHGVSSVCVYTLETMDFVGEIPVGPRPDCHSTSVNNRYLYIACEDGLWCIDQQSLEVVKRLETGHVYGTNVMPDGNTMLLHDAFGGMFILKDIEDMNKIHIHKRLDILGTHTSMDTLGGKGHFLGNGRYYLCNGWTSSRIYILDMIQNYSWEIFTDVDPILFQSDDLVISCDKTRLYSACYNTQGYVAVTDVKTRSVIKTIPAGTGTCGLTMSNDERYVIASNDGDDSITVIDTNCDEAVMTLTAKKGFMALQQQSYIQGISIGQNDEIYVYGCAGNGALVKFTDICTGGRWMIGSAKGKYSSLECSKI